MSIGRHLVVFTRLPRLGAGKRRLAVDIGSMAALRFQRVTFAAILRRLGGDRRWRTWLAITPDRSGPWPSGFSTLNQGSGDLGQRMVRVANMLPPGPSVIVGSDIPDLSARHVIEAFNTLGSHDAVFGPTIDGGFWLIGFKHWPHQVDIFSGVRWSTKYALADAMACLRLHSIAQLQTLDDVDDGAALVRLRLKDARYANCRV